MGRATGPGRAPRPVPVPGHAARRGAARPAVPVPFGRVGRARLGVRARGRPAHGRADLRADLGADGRRARRPDAARRPGHRRARRGPVRHRPRRGPVRPDAAGRRPGSGARPGPRQRRRYPPGGAAAVAPPGLGGGRRRQVRVRRVARRVGLSRRVVPAPVLVPPGRLRRRPAVPGHPRPDAAREPAHEHGVREVLHLARGAEPGLPGGHAARLRRGRRVPGRPRSAGAGRPPPGRGGLRPEPQRRHEPSEPLRPLRALRPRRALP